MAMNRSNIHCLATDVANKQYVSNLPVLHVTNSYFRNVTSYQTHDLDNMSQRYNRKLSTHMGKHVKKRSAS